jgi:adenylate cyclase
MLALLGFAMAGRDVSTLAAQPGWVEETLRRAGTVTEPQEERLVVTGVSLLSAYGAATAVALLAPRWRRRRGARRATVHIRYTAGPDVVVPIGFTVLEASRLA